MQLFVALFETERRTTAKYNNIYSSRMGAGSSIRVVKGHLHELFISYSCIFLATRILDTPTSSEHNTSAPSASS